MTNPTPKWLVVKLADIGDLLTITPALSHLRKRQPTSVIHVLTTAHSAPVLPQELADRVIVFDKFAFDRPRDAISPVNLRQAIQLGRHLYKERYDGVIILHHLTTPFGALKYAALALATGAHHRIGLDNGRGWFLSSRVYDDGFGAAHEADVWLAVIDCALGLDTAPLYTPAENPMQIRIDTADQAWAHNLLDQAGGRPRIVIHPGSGGYSLARRWNPESFAVVADQLHDRLNAQIVLVGGKCDNTLDVMRAMQHDPLDLTGQTTIGQLGALLAESDLFIGADSGVMHMAAAAGTRVLALFGPSNASAWGPWTARAEVLRTAPVCSPCSYVMHTVGQRDGCAARTCMAMLTPREVIAATQRLLQDDIQPPTPGGHPGPHADTRPHILGVPLNPITWHDLRKLLRQWIASGIPHQFCTVNPEFIMVAQQDVNFYNILHRADLCAADGQGLLWAARHLGAPLPQRITGSDGVPLIAQWAAEDGWSLFLLGAAEGVAARAADVLQAQYPGLKIAGTYAGSPAPDEEQAIVERINASGADILFVAYGAPKQDKWVARNLPRLRVKAAGGVGGSLDFIAGVQKRAPVAWQRLGLEWLYRLIQEPWRWRRMTRLPRFVLAVLRRGRRGPARFEGPHHAARPATRP